MTKLKWIVALLVAITLFGAPTLAHAQTGEESSESIEAHSDSSTPPTPSPTTSDTTLTPTDETATPSEVLPAESPQLTEPTASGPTSEPNSDSSEPVAPSTSASSPTPTPLASTVPDFKYVLAVWENPAGSPKFPQYLVQWYLTDSTDVKVLAQWATKCGTFYQSDLYANDTRTQDLLAKGVLNGGDESWPLDAYGHMIQRYDTFTTEPCPPVTPTPEPTEPEVTPSPSTPTTPPTPTEPTTPPLTIPSSPSPTPSIPTSSTDGPQPESSVESGPSIEQKVDSTTTAPPTESTDTASSLAYTGSSAGAGFIFLGVLLIVLGFVLYRNRK